ncbi:methylamine utilization protein [Gammaproteobacteria bacterium LSUCC0112]|nr:methylamine utilization protein [Gammaproteobacteria bacterium LSUCC0112]
MDLFPGNTARGVKRATRINIRKNFFITTSLATLPFTCANAFDLRLNFIDEQQQSISGVVAEVAGRPVGAAPAEPAIMDQINRRFVPMIVLVQTGELVSFPNSDNVRHHVYSFSDIRQFSTPLYADEHVDPVMFDKPGVAVLGCNIHDSMVGYVYVSRWQDRAISDENGVMTFTELSEKPQTFSVWHPWLQTPENTLEIDLSAVADGVAFDVTLPVKSPDTQFGFRALVPEASR